MTSKPRLANPAENQQGEWRHRTAHDYSPTTGAVAACLTCGWGENGPSGSWAMYRAQQHREEYGRKPVEPVKDERRVIEPPKDQPGKPGRKPTAQHGSVALYNRGCRCEPCTAAKAAYKKARRATEGRRRA